MRLPILRIRCRQLRTNPPRIIELPSPSLSLGTIPSGSLDSTTRKHQCQRIVFPHPPHHSPNPLVRPRSLTSFHPPTPSFPVSPLSFPCPLTSFPPPTPSFPRRREPNVPHEPSIRTARPALPTPHHVLPTPTPSFPQPITSFPHTTHVIPAKAGISPLTSAARLWGCPQRAIVNETRRWKCFLSIADGWIMGYYSPASWR